MQKKVSYQKSKGCLDVFLWNVNDKNKVFCLDTVGAVNSPSTKYGRDKFWWSTEHNLILCRGPVVNLIHGLCFKLQIVIELRMTHSSSTLEEKIWKSFKSTFILHCNLCLVAEGPATWGGGDLLSPIVNFPRVTHLVFHPQLDWRPKTGLRPNFSDITWELFSPERLV